MQSKQPGLTHLVDRFKKAVVAVPLGFAAYFLAYIPLYKLYAASVRVGASLDQQSDLGLALVFIPYIAGGIAVGLAIKRYPVLGAAGGGAVAYLLHVASYWLMAHGFDVAIGRLQRGPFATDVVNLDKWLIAFSAGSALLAALALRLKDRLRAS